MHSLRSLSLLLFLDVEKIEISLVYVLHLAIRWESFLL